MRELMQELVAEMVRKDIPLEMALREFERTFLQQVLAAHQGNQSATARKLGMHRNTLSKKLERSLPQLRYPVGN